MLEVFLNEARDLLEQLEAALLDLETRPTDRELINTTFRALHTLKGSGGMFGPPAMAAFAHELENAFEKVRQDKVPVTPRLVSLLLQSADQIRKLLFEPGDHSEASRRLAAALNEEVGTAAPAVAAPAAMPVATASAPAGDAKRWRIRLRLEPNALQFGTNPVALFDELRDLGTLAVTADLSRLPPLVELAPTELHLGWEMVLETAAARSQIEDVFIFVDGPDAVLIEALDAAPAAVSPSAEVAPPAAAAAPLPQAAAPAPKGEEARGEARTEAHVRVSASRLDLLLDQVGELVIAQARLTALARNRRDPVLSTVSEEIERLSADLRDSAMGMRMVPIETLFGRYRRVVRDISSDLGKEIDLVFTGEETELDKTVLDRLGDPMVHIIRNSLDHGIESAERRLAAGKPARGHLRLGARQAGTEVVITIEDDGAGLNRARILEKAQAAGVVPEGVTPPDREIDELIFHPGLSTAATVSNLSGRGVGMDVVRRTITELHGSIEIDTRPGEGTRFLLRLPLTLAIVDGLQVSVGETQCILPLTSVEECVELSAVESRASNGRNFVDIRGTLVPLLWMHEVFNEGERGGVVVVVESDTGKLGVVVNQVVGQHQTVIKPVSPLHAGTPGLAGATILGDGTVALILDVNPLARHAVRQRADAVAA
ncbi:chemotaxis protein CheA [Aureimonas sp. AU4]|uniref:chemotaxis protein CheA n=1 Tax=Aureimonas sp. AU4 TaxID=1638163 RepID=UPI00278BF50B|nr:chemotaxis protein CheA [Aureimonas sp. AU4]